MPILFRSNLFRREKPALSNASLADGENSLALKNPQKDRIVLRKSIFFIILSFIIIELIFDSIYLFIKIPPLYFQIPINFQNYLMPFYFGIFVLLNTVKLFLMVAIAIRWITSVYEIRAHEIRHRYGILNRKEKIYMCDLAQEVEYSQSLIGKIFNFGSVQIHNPAIKESIHLEAIPNPAKYTDIIKKNLPSTPLVDFVV